ncbi:TlpA family protein disulfide reductase, partial [Burkholderia pseudomallei]|nr:TlpA family protein disulfide reductase [Burkholderia pseudomallei]MBF3912897.1 TlpA family protein disulfide reductase [Burkholderia pseudomallei]
AALDPRWRGELPRTLWIGEDGTRRAKSGLLAPAVLDAWLQRREP